MSKRAAVPHSTLSVQIIVLAAIAWAVIALLFFLLFSVSSTDGERPEWYSTVTYILENVAFLGAGWLCFRNWRSSLIVSGKQVWLAIGLGMSAYFIGNLCLAYWEIGLGLSPDVSPGDFFFIFTYLFLVWGMLQAVFSKRLNLTPIQWAILAGIAVAGMSIALMFAPVSREVLPTEVPSVEQTTPLSASSAPVPSGSLNPTASPDLPNSAGANGAAGTSEPTNSQAANQTIAPPHWATRLDEHLFPLANVVAWLYIIGDVLLVVMATTLLLAFWGGRFSQSWRFVAAAAFSFYIADIWFNYAIGYIPNYQTGALPEVFWIFSGCLFGIGAALEYDLSTRRRSTRRRG